MATQSKFPMRAVKTVNAVPIPRYSWGEKALNTHVRGALLFLDTSGRLTECGADPALIAGVATAPGTNNAVDFAASGLVEIAHPDVVFRAYADTSASEGTGVLTTAAIGKAYGVAKAAAGGLWYVDIADTTADRMIIWGSWDETVPTPYALTDIRPHVYASFCAAVCQTRVGT
jgi:hypothetical protein